MDLFIYSDESGVFDNKHEDFFVFGGLICFGKKEKDSVSRKYRHVESVIRFNSAFSQFEELKAYRLNSKQKYSIYRSLNNVFKFAVIIDQKRVLQNIFESKKHKQRYLDFCYKMVLKKALDSLIKNNVLKTADIVNVHIYCDEHTTATNGLYELKEALLNEFKYGTFNMEYDLFYDPILPTMNALNVNYCNSAKTTLVRAADIIANHVYYKVTRDKKGLLKEKGIFIYAEPSNKIIKNGLEVFRK